MTRELELLIRGGSVVTPEGIMRQDVGIAGGTIVALYNDGEDVPPAAKVIDATGKHVLPGGVDAHVHTRAPARPDRETWQSGTAAAARSGVTTIIEMPMSNPPGSTASVIRDRIASAQGECYVDFAIYGGGGWQDERAIREQADEGIVGYKVLSHGPPPGREHEFVGLFAETNAELFGSLREIAKTGLPVSVHAEDASLLHLVESEVRAAHAGDPRDHVRSRPAWVEEVSIATLLVLARETGAKLHLPHIGSAAAMNTAARARHAGHPVTVETSPHYLSFDQDLMLEKHGFAKMNPPLRTVADQEALWAGLTAGDIDIVASDHGPNLPEEKQGETIWDANAGNPGLEAIYSVVVDGAIRGRTSFETVASAMAAAPVRIFGLPCKGKIDVGYDADVVVCNTEATWTFRKEECSSNSRESYEMYEGKEFRGAFETVVSRGRIVAEHGNVVGSRSGSHITPAS
ncbi:dihydroorotase [Paramicrobacterium agarici]|uniref:dihydroorotase n=1 Tax=Paramicrobacterium agarici TaxID=630514 RepID=UPI00114E6EE5|nr:dihydroorotase/allantoinase [Microbacterium agarici]